MDSVIGTASGVVLTLLIAVVAYPALITLIRLAGKRSIGKWNAFDLVVTVALGSTLATVIVSRSVPILTGLAALAALLLFQFVITWLSVRSSVVHRLVRSQPALVLRDGRMLERALREERVAESEVLSAVRQSGYGDLREVAAVVLETDGSLSVIGSVPDDSDYTTLRDVRTPADHD